jgi:hypothetical protein
LDDTPHIPDCGVPRNAKLWTDGRLEPKNPGASRGVQFDDGSNLKGAGGGGEVGAEARPDLIAKNQLSDGTFADKFLFGLLNNRSS